VRGTGTHLEHVGTLDVPQEPGLRLGQPLWSPAELRVAQERAVLVEVLGGVAVPPGASGSPALVGEIEVSGLLVRRHVHIVSSDIPATHAAASLVLADRPSSKGDDVRVGLLTGGGDVPGLNAAIRAVVKRAEGEHGHTVVGFRNGWRGLADGDVMPLTRSHIRNVLPTGGTLLGTARYHPHADDGGLDAVRATLEQERIEALICIGGDGTLHAASKVAETGVRIVAIPKTIDNDVWGTDRSIGFDTAVTIATEAVDRIHTTAESHNRVMIIEVMGRHAGWIAASAGIAGGAEIVLAPEEPFDIDKIVRFLRHRHRAHASFSIIVVAEGAVPAEGTSMTYSTQLGPFGQIVAGAIGERLGAEIGERTGFDTRVTVLGHVQRGGTPTPTDRILGSRFGVAAVDAVSAGSSGVMTALHGDEVVLVPLSEIAGKVKQVPIDLLEVAGALA
jgi:phosphofructokinase-like protein